MRIPLTILLQSDLSSCVGEPVSFGVPLPRGAATDGVCWVVESSGGAAVVDARVIDRWHDGSARWMLVDTRVQSWFDDATVIRPAEPKDLAGVERISLTQEDGCLAVDTGIARFVFRRGGSFPFDGVTAGGLDLADCAAPDHGLVVTTATGNSSHGRVDDVNIEHAGQLRVSVRLVGTLPVGSRTAVVVARVDLFAGLAAARVRLTIRNRDRAQHPGNYWDLGDQGSILIRDLSVRLALPKVKSSTPRLRVATESGSAWFGVQLPFELYQDSSGGDGWQSTNHLDRQRRVPTSFRGYRLSGGDGAETRGHRATPAVGIECGGHAMAVAVPAFWQNFPRAITASDCGLALHLFPGQFATLHELQGGEQKTHEFYLALGVDQASWALVDQCRRPTLVSPHPAWYEATAAVDLLAPLEAGHATLAVQAVNEPTSFERKRDVIDQFGWRHFGEIYGDHEAIGQMGAQPLVSHYNNQYDPVLGFGLQFLRTGDRRWWSAMDELAKHLIDIDIYHTAQDKAAYNGGLFWHTYHYGDADTATHRTYPARNTGTVSGGGPSADHNYPAGLVLHYFLTGDEASREAAIGLADYVLNLDDGRLSPFRFLSHADTGRAIFTPPDYFGPSRSSGNSLAALVDGHRLTHDERFIAKADKLVARVISPADNQKAFRLDEPEFRWFYLMFLQALGKYLRYKAELGEIDRYYAHGRASLLAYARWMTGHEYPYLSRPERLEYPTETWAAQDIRKVDVFCYAALLAEADERDTFLERAAFFHDNSVATLNSMATRSLARPVILLLTSGAVLSWFKRNADARMPIPVEQMRPFPAEAFVPQRKIAERRAMALAAVLILGVAAAVVWAVARSF